MKIIKILQIIALILTMIDQVQSSCFDQLPQIRTNSIKPIILLTSSASDTTLFTATFSTPLDVNPVYTYTWGLGLIGYESYITDYFCINVTSTIKSTQMAISLKACENTYLTMLKYRYIATILDSTSSPSMQVLAGCYKCLTINQANNGYGDRSQIILQSSTIPGSSTIKVQSFIFALNVSNSIGRLNQLSIKSTLTGGSYEHNISTSQNMTIHYVCLTTIAWQNSTDQPGQDIAAFMDSYLLTSMTLSSPIDLYKGFACQNLNFFGLSMFNHDKAGTRFFQLFPQDYDNINTKMLVNSHFLSLTVEIFYVADTNCIASNAFNASNASIASTPFYDFSLRECLVVCDASSPYPVSNGASQCVGCSKYCSICTSETTCTTCMSGLNRGGAACNCLSGFFDYSNTQSLCVDCSLLIKFCIVCTNDSSLTTTVKVRCTGCLGTRIVYNNLCQCQNLNPNNTFEVSGLCLSYPGCLVASGNVNNPLCTSCNQTGNFILVSIKCQCKVGFSYNIHTNYDKCQSICGTGYVQANSTKCDDNNTDTTDGCANCVVMTGWICSIVNGTTGPSFCVKKSTISFNYLYSLRVKGANQAQIYFSVSTTSSNALTSSVFTEATIQTNISNDKIQSSYDPSTKRLKVTVQFLKDMQSGDHSFKFTFTSSKTNSFYSDPVQVHINTQGINQALTISNFVIMINSLTYLLAALSVSCIIIALIATIFNQKLMAIELILPIQATYFMAFTIQKLPLYIMEFKYLIYINGYNSLFKYDYEKYLQIETKLPKYDYQVEFFLNFNVSSGILIVSFIVFAVLQLIYYYKYSKLLKMQSKNIDSGVQNIEMNKKKSKTQKNSKGQKEQQKIKPIISQQQALYSQQVKQSKQNIKKYVNNLYFFINVFFTQSCLFAFVMQNSQKKVNTMFLSENINLMMAYVDILIIIGNLTFLIAELFEKKDKRMISFADIKTLKYPTFIIISYVLITATSSLINTFKYSPLIITGLSALPLIFFLYFRPYVEHKFINTLGSILTQCLPILASVIYLLLYINSIQQILLLILTGTIVVYILLLQIYTIIRMCKIIDWSDYSICKRFIKADKNGMKTIQQKNEEIELNAMIKENMLKDNEGLNWEERNKKEYQSVEKQVVEEQSMEKSQNNDNEEENQLILFKKRLKKELESKRRVY